MSDRVSVTVSEDKKTVCLAVGNFLGAHRQIIIDLSDAGSIISGLIAATNAGDQMVQAQFAQLAQRVDALERLAKNDKAVGAS